MIQFALKRFRMKNILFAFIVAALAHQGSSWVFLQCQFRMENAYPGFGPVYTCVGTFTFFDVDEMLVSVVGNHMEGRTNADVQQLIIVPFQETPFIPRNFPAFLPNIRHIEWWFSSLDNITAQELQQFPALQSFSALNNQLTRLPSNLFMGNPQLRYVEFSYEQLVTIENNLLGSLGNLNDVRFLQNPCIDEEAFGRDAVINLNTRLHILCPAPGDTTTPIPTPPTTPQPGDCQAGCQNQINLLFQENQQLRNQVENLNMRLSRIEDFVCQTAGLLC